MHIVKCKIADFNLDFNTDIKVLHKIMHEYLGDFEAPDISLTLSDQELEAEKLAFPGDPARRYATTFKKTAFFRKFADRLPSRNAFVLHSACFDVEGEGVAFAAHSGTGKTTHMNLWQGLLGDKMTVVNGDKPIVRFFDDEPTTPYAYGTPWNG